MISVGKKRRRAVVNQSACVACGCCAKVCPLRAIEIVRGVMAQINPEKCVGCGLCAKECPVGVIHVPAAYAQQVMSPAQEEAPAANA